MGEQIKYKRVLLKLSGEALSQNAKGILNFEILKNIGQKLKICIEEMGISFGIVVGAGNIWRGTFGKTMNRARSDHMGMIATVINALALQDALGSESIDSRVMTAVEMNKVAEPYIISKALSHLNKGKVCIFAGGTGNPFFTTDTASVLRAAEIGADVVLLAKNHADGVYSADPNIFPDATKFEELEYKDILNDDKLRAMDVTTASFSKENKIPIWVIGIDDPENIVKALKGEKIGTLIEK
ncbi:MAG: UMP kinase [Oscillospiraceae bacterium]|nr:UMP kinase [Oscillospiraceae bacterium]